MAQKIEWTLLALDDFHSIIVYLEKVWSVTIADAFITETEKRLLVLLQQPFIGIASLKMPEVRSILLTKQNRLYYKIEGEKLIVLGIFDTRQEPSRSPF